MFYNTIAEHEKLRQLRFDCPHEVDLYEKYELEIDDMDEVYDLEGRMYEWCKENCRGSGVYEGDFRFLFEKEDEAAAFKMAWS